MATEDYGIFRMTVGGSVLEPDEQRLLVLSDVEMGAGGLEDDCPHSEAIADFLLRYQQRHRGLPLNIVFNGDTFDFLKTSVDGVYPRYVSERLALLKLERIVAAHSGFFARMRRLLSEPDVTVTFVTGNHDFELVFPRVQMMLQEHLGPQVKFAGMTYEYGPVRIEHGSQGDALYRIDPERALIEHDGEMILNLPWAAVGVLDVMMPYHRQFYLLDRIRSKQALFQMLPEARALFMALAKKYIFHDYWHDLWIERDPLKHLRWGVIKEVIGRMISADPEVGFGTHYMKLLETGEHQVVIVGHEHSGRVCRSDRGTLMTTGCLRNEFELHPESGTLTTVERSIAEVRLYQGQVADARLIPVELPVGPQEDMRALQTSLRTALDDLRRGSDDEMGWTQAEVV